MTSRTPVGISATSMRTCHGDELQTWDALLAGACGVGPLELVPAEMVNVSSCYRIRDERLPHADGRTAALLGEVVRDVVRTAKLDARTQRVAVVIGTGLRELRTLERRAVEGNLDADCSLDVDAAVREQLPEVTDIVTVSNACAAGGYALAMGQDIVLADEADAVIVAGVDTLTASMLAMIGLVAKTPTSRVRPFDVDRTGVLLGEGAAAVVLEPQRPGMPRLRGVGIGCDAYNETTPDADGIAATMRAAHADAGVGPRDIDLVVSHGTGTGLNDPTESAALTRVFGSGRALPVTALKGSIGHTSGSAALVNLIVAVRAIGEGAIPGVVGLDTPIPEAAQLELLTTTTLRPVHRAQINAFGFGGVNAVAIVEAA